MERVIQQDGTGCGLACVAMLAGEKYETVRDKAIDVLPPLFNDDFGRRRGRGYSLWTCYGKFVLIVGVESCASSTRRRAFIAALSHVLRRISP